MNCLSFGEMKSFKWSGVSRWHHPGPDTPRPEIWELKYFRVTLSYKQDQPYHVFQWGKLSKQRWHCASNHISKQDQWYHAFQ